MRPTKRAFAIVACVAAASLGGACGAFTSTDPPVSPPPDASTAPDGGADRDLADGPDAGTLCPPTAEFCDDFERGPTGDIEQVRGAWESSDTANGALQIVAVDGGRALAVDITPGADSAASVFLERGAKVQPGLELRFKLLVAKAPSAQVQVAAITLYQASREVTRISLELTGTQLGIQDRTLLQDGGPPSYGSLVNVGTVGGGRWRAVKLWVEAPATSGAVFRASIDSDGAGKGGPLPTRPLAVDSGRVTLGDKNNGNPAAAASLRFDDVVVLAR